MLLRVGGGKHSMSRSMLDSFPTLEWVTVVEEGAGKVLLKRFTAAELSDAISQLPNVVPG